VARGTVFSKAAFMRIFVASRAIASGDFGKQEVAFEDLRKFMVTFFGILVTFLTFDFDMFTLEGE
jgi:hypothetical protein